MTHAALRPGLSGSSYAAALGLMRAKWLRTARHTQLPPRWDFENWLLLAGRGFGKTRIGAEDTVFKAATRPNTRWMVVAPTHHDCRTVCFEGESGIMSVIPPALIDGEFNRSDLELRLKNGSLIAGLSAEKPNRARGPQWHGAWLDELASWQRLQEMWDNIEFSLRLGRNPQKLITTTPRPLDFLRELAKSPTTALTRGSTYDNAANLSARAVARMRSTYENTSKGRQELHGDILDEAIGALWSTAMIERARVQFVKGNLRRIVVAIDPAVTSTANSDETGIIVCGVDGSEQVYVLEDASGTYSPREWAKRALALYHQFQADKIIGEVNNGGDLVEANLRAVAAGQHFSYTAVRAKRGKYIRAEPVASLYEKGRVHHVGVLAKLEAQMTKWKGVGDEDSPDRLDALVYGVTELILGEQENAFW